MAVRWCGFDKGSRFMPGMPHKDIDTSSWGIRQWRLAQAWNACFLIVWTWFYWQLFADLRKCQSPWFMFAPLFVIGGAGFAWQSIKLVRLSVWLHKQKNERDSP